VIPLLSRDAVRGLDRDAVDRLGIPSLVLMENAGARASAAICVAFPAALDRVVVVGGPGQNGGDGWVVARHLACLGWVPRVVLLGSPERLAGDAQVNWRALERLDIPRCHIAGDDLTLLAQELAQSSLVIDAIFGTGLNRPLHGKFAQAVELINGRAGKVVALDLPSGVDADSGALLGSAVRADRTVTFAAHKRGLDQYPGYGLAGVVECVSIGVPVPGQAPLGRLEASDVSSWLQARAADAHKGSAGHVLLIAGSRGHTGAAVLSGLGALRSGAGLCTIVPRSEVRAAIEAKVLELMTAELPQEPAAAVAAAHALAVGKSAVVIGPGLGLDGYGHALARELASSLPVPVVLDADALTAIGQDHAGLRRAGGPRVLTPHPGEAGRLLGVRTDQVQADRYAAAEQLAARTGAVVVLKGARTIVADPSGLMRVSPTGTPAMATGGTGDVLSGVIAAQFSHMPAFEAASAGVYLHGLAGELAAFGDRGLLASELAAALPRAIARCKGD
jgi:NAD(P)H-hydrate epimerase